MREPAQCFSQFRIGLIISALSESKTSDLGVDPTFVSHRIVLFCIESVNRNVQAEGLAWDSLKRELQRNRVESRNMDGIEQNEIWKGDCTTYLSV